MMDIQEFMGNLAAEIRGRLGEGYRVERKNVLKNNSVTAHAITIRRQDEDIAPCIYIDDLYTRYLSGDVDISSAAGEVIRPYREHAAGPGIGISLFTDPETAISKVHGRLINTEMNCCLLEDIPHRGFLDLSLVYVVGLSQYGGMAREILIHDDHLDIWGIDETDLYSAVCRGMEEADGVVLEKMDTILSPWLGQDAGMGAARRPMYVLTNKGCRDGAVQLLNKKALASAADLVDTDSLIILPSSINELILLPGSCGDTGRVHELADIVRAVNDTEVLEQEILSYHVYRYSRESGEVTIAA